MSEIPKPVPPTDITESRRVALRTLVDMSRGFPQIGLHDPAGIVERSMASAEARTATREKMSIQTPEALTEIFPTADSQKPEQTEIPNQIKPKRELFRRIFGHRIF